MRHIKRFCCSLSIAMGTQIIGWLNIADLVLLASIFVVVQLYRYLVFLILPVLCFHTFLKMVKKDSTRMRTRFYILTVISSVVQPLVYACVLFNARTEQTGVAYDIFGTSPAFEITACGLGLFVLWHIYCSLIVYQHRQNKKIGRGDARHDRNSNIPEYLITQQTWVAELN